MTDLTPRQLVDAITRSLNETWQRMAAKYKSVATDQSASRPRAAEDTGHVRRNRTARRPPNRPT